MEVGIVGGGVGGLTTALLLSHRGVQVTLYERSDTLGGRLAYQEGGGYRIDQGPTIVLLPEMILSILQEGGIDRSRIPLMECDPLYKIHYADGTHLVKHRSIERQLEELDAKFPDEAEGFRKFMRDMEASFTEGKKAFLDRPFLRKSEFYTVRNIAILTKLKAYKSVRRLVGQYFKKEKLKDAFSLQTLYIGGAPFESPALYSLLPYAEHAYGVWYLKGGYAALVSLLEEELVKRGVVIKKNTAVESLLIDHGICRGLVTAQGEQLHDSVVYNGEFPGMNALLPTKVRPPAKFYKPSSGCVLVYLGLNRQWPEAGVHQFFLPPSLTTGLEQIFNEGRLPDDPSFYVFYPSAIDKDAAPDGESVMYILIPVPPVGKVDWRNDTAPLVEHVLREAERRGFPGLGQAIRWMDVRTPEDAENDGLYQGGSFGIAPILTQSAVFRPQIVPYPIEQLYAVGASVHPGGGIPIVMQGAKLLAARMLAQTSLTATMEDSAAARSI